jgi:hypothetical protein
MSIIFDSHLASNSIHQISLCVILITMSQRPMEFSISPGADMKNKETL